MPNRKWSDDENPKKGVYNFGLTMLAKKSNRLFLRILSLLILSSFTSFEILPSAWAGSIPLGEQIQNDIPETSTNQTPERSTEEISRNTSTDFLLSDSPLSLASEEQVQAPFSVTSSAVQKSFTFPDFNLDGFVGQDDLNVLITHWGSSGSDLSFFQGDVNGDHFIGQEDLNAIISNWGVRHDLQEVEQTILNYYGGSLPEGGNLSTEEVKDSEGNLLYWLGTVILNQSQTQGQLQNQLFYVKEIAGKFLITEVKDEDSQNQLLKWELFDYDSQGIKLKSFIQTYYANGQVNLLEETHYALGVQTTRTYQSYDSTGSRTRFLIESYDTNGKLQSSDDYEYSSGKLIKRVFNEYDSTGVLSNTITTNFPQSILISNDSYFLTYFVDGTQHQETLILTQGENAIQRQVQGYGGPLSQ